MKTTVSLKVDSDVKKQATQVAHDLGFSLSAIVNANLKQLVQSRELHVSVAPKMTSYLEAAVKTARQDFAAGRLKTYNSANQMFADLDQNKK